MRQSRIVSDELVNSGHWENLWAERWDAREAMYVGQAHLGYWQARAEDFSDGRKACDFCFGRKVVEALSPFLPERAEVLDVGAGPGSLLVPLGRAGHRVTAVEPAEAMLRQLADNAAAAGVGDYRVLPLLWQEVDVEGLRGSFDLAISSITMWMFRDLAVQLRRLETVSRGLCCVVGGAGGDSSGQPESRSRMEPGDHTIGLWERVMGGAPKPDYSEFPLVFNLLYAMGRLPEVRIVEYETERSVESKIRQQKLFYSKYTRLSPEIESLIEDAVMDAAEQGMVKERPSASVVFWKSQQAGV